MNDSFFSSAAIETTILVAAWSEPVVFQGYYKITLPDNDACLVLYYRVVCTDYQQKDFLNEEFYPEQFSFTHLYNQQEVIKTQEMSEEASYLLKYPLFISITQMLKNKKQYLTYIDEVALNSLIIRTAVVINNPTARQQHEDLGFSVNMNFEAREKTSADALTALIHLAQY